mgnify:CR=1 FL=1
MEKQNAPKPIDLIGLLPRLLKQLKRFWIFVLVLTVLLAGVNYIRVRRSYVPMYESKATFSVSSGYGDEDIFSASYYYDNTAAKDLAAAFPHLLSTDMMRDQMLLQLNKSYINGSISASSVADTNLFELRVRSSSPQDAHDILNAVIVCYPKVAVMMVENPQVAVRQEPTVPTVPYNTFSGKGPAMIGAMLGFVLGMALVLVAAILNKTITTPEELKQAVNLPMLATLPHVTKKTRTKNGKQETLLRAERDQGLAEAMRGLRTKVHKLLDPQGGKVIMLTSTMPGEGKSTMAANLALALAAEGHTVALVDADLRNQSVHRMLGKEPCPKNLMDCMKDPRISPLRCLQAADRSGLYFLSGNSVQNRHYSVDVKAVRRILEEMKPHFDYIVLDSSPCGIVSDTALLGHVADGLLFIIKQDHAPQSQIMEALTGLHERDLVISGCVLNDMPRSRLRQSKGYGYGYGKSKKYGQ